MRTTARTAAFFTGACQVDGDGAAIHRHAVQRANSRLAGVGRGHFDKAEAFGAAAVAVHHDLGRGDGAKFSKVAFQAGIGHGIRQVANVDFGAHGESLRGLVRQAVAHRFKLNVGTQSPSHPRAMDGGRNPLMRCTRRRCRLEPPLGKGVCVSRFVRVEGLVETKHLAVVAVVFRALQGKRGLEATATSLL